MARTDGTRVSILHDQKDDGTATMSAQWDYKGGPVGVWVVYNQEISHKRAFSILMEGLWKSMQEPEEYRVDQEHRGEMTIKPYWDGIG